MIDAGIPLAGQAPQVPQGLQLLSQVGQLNQQQANLATTQQEQQQRGIQMQGQSLALAGAQQEAGDHADFRAATAGATDPITGAVDRGKLLSTLGRLNPVVAAQTASNLTQQDAAAKDAAAKSQELQISAAQAHLKLKDQLLQGATDPVSWANARNIAIQNGINPNELPVQYDPQFVAQAHAQTMSQQQTLDAQLAQRKQNDVEAGQDETNRHNTVEEKLTGSAQAQTARYQKGELGVQYARLAMEKQQAAQSQADPKAAAQLLVDGDATLSELKSRGATPQFLTQTLANAKIMSGGKYNSQAADAQFSVAKSPANVAFFGSAKSLTDQGGTLDQLSAAAKDIPGHQLPVFNTIADAEKAAAGSGPIAKYASLLLGVSDDYSKVMGGGQGSDSSRAQALKLVPANASPEARDAAIQGIRGAVGSQINSRIGNNKVLSRMYGDVGASQQSGGMITVQIPGSPAGQIPASALAKFKADHPNAQVQQ